MLYTTVHYYTTTRQVCYTQSTQYVGLSMSDSATISHHNTGLCALLLQTHDSSDIQTDTSQHELLFRAIYGYYIIIVI